MACPKLLFHGTSVDTASALSSRTQKVDVGRGGGEFGRGFYLGRSAPYCLRFAIGRCGVTNARVLAFQFDPTKLAKLKFVSLDVKKARQVVRAVRNKRLEGTWTKGVDLVGGPIEADRNYYQVKFESAASAVLLNDSSATTIGVHK